jgi:hypothetical protein
MQHGASTCTFAIRPRGMCLGAPLFSRVERGAGVTPYRLRRRLLRFGFVALTIASSIARWWRWIADTAALVHQPAIVLAQVNMRLRGVGFMCPRELQMSERPAASLTPHQPCRSVSAHSIGVSACTAANLRPRGPCLGASWHIAGRARRSRHTLLKAPDHPHGTTQARLRASAFA